MQKFRLCVGGIIRKADDPNLILIGQRNPRNTDIHLTNNNIAYQFPQGGVEENESLKDAAFREIEEEFGIKKNKLNLIRKLLNEGEAIGDGYKYEAPANSWLVKNGYKGQEIHFYLFDFNGNIETDCDITQSHDVGYPNEFCDLKWMNINNWDSELQPYVIDFKKDLYLKLKLSLLT